jgi:hypothetical protein
MKENLMGKIDKGLKKAEFHGFRLFAGDLHIPGFEYDC